MQEICIVIPCYNEEKRLPVKEIISFLETYAVSLLFVNDGSTDATSKILNTIHQQFPDKTKVTILKNNSGKGEAVRAGILECMKWKPFGLMGYFDADLSTPLTEVFLLEKQLAEKKAGFAFGSRLLRAGASIKRSSLRHYFSRVFATMASVLLGLPVYDTQCGAKLIRSDLAKELFAKKFSSRWLFDIELFFRLIALKGKESALKEMIEVPLNTWHDSGNSKMSFFYFIKAPVELFVISLLYRKRA